jgi:hypothetical protein
MNNTIRGIWRQFEGFGTAIDMRKPVLKMDKKLVSNLEKKIDKLDRAIIEVEDAYDDLDMDNKKRNR